jgi:hypothetical protein
MTSPWYHGMQSTPFVNCQAAHACGSPALAVVWQSEETEAGCEQLVTQYVPRSSQLRSGGAPFPESGVLGDSDGPGVSVQAPRRALLFCSVHVMMVPPTHEVWPHASVRRSPFCSTAQLQLSFDEDEHATDVTQPMVNTREAARTVRGPRII